MRSGFVLLFCFEIKPFNQLRLQLGQEVMT